MRAINISDNVAFDTFDSWSKVLSTLLTVDKVEFDPVASVY